MDIYEIITNITISILSGLIGGFISYYFAEKTENYKFQLLKNQQASRVAELFALWIKYSDSEVKKLSKIKRRDHQERLNKLTWELAMWIPDEELVKRIMCKLNWNSQDDIKDLILKVREVIQYKESEKLKAGDIVNFDFFK